MLQYSQQTVKPVYDKPHCKKCYIRIFDDSGVCNDCAINTDANYYPRSKVIAEMKNKIVSIDVMMTAGIFGVSRSTIYKWISWSWLTKEGVHIVTDSMFWELAETKCKMIEARSVLGCEKISSLKSNSREREDSQTYSELLRMVEDLQKENQELRGIIQGVSS